MLNRLDDFLLEKVFQKISDNFQKATGKNCLFLARILVLISIALDFIIGFIIIAISWYDPLNLLVLLLLTRTILANFKHLKNMQDREERETKVLSSSAEVANVKKLLFKPLRIFSLANNILFDMFFIVFDVINTTLLRSMENKLTLFMLVANLSLSCHTASIYFSCCTPLPPCKSKIKAFLTSKTSQPVASES